MSKFSTHNTRNQNNRNANRGRNNASRHHGKPSPKPAQFTKITSKAEAMADSARVPTHQSKFVQANSGGLMALIKVDGRVVFPDSRGPQPKNDGKVWQFQIVGENPKQTVWFARIVNADEAWTSSKIVISQSGKIVCLGRRPIKLSFRSTKPKHVRLSEYRHATPNMGFERQDNDFDFYADDGYGDSHHGCGCGHDHDDREDCDGDNEYGSASVFFQEASIWDSLPTKPVNCHACGFEDCRCDGTANDWVPARTTLNVLG